MTAAKALLIGYILLAAVVADALIIISLPDPAGAAFFVAQTPALVVWMLHYMGAFRS